MGFYIQLKPDGTVGATVESATAPLHTDQVEVTKEVFDVAAGKRYDRIAGTFDEADPTLIEVLIYNADTGQPQGTFKPGTAMEARLFQGKVLITTVPLVVKP